DDNFRMIMISIAQVTNRNSRTVLRDRHAADNVLDLVLMRHDGGTVFSELPPAGNVQTPQHIVSVIGHRIRKRDSRGRAVSRKGECMIKDGQEKPEIRIDEGCYELMSSGPSIDFHLRFDHDEQGGSIA